MDKLSVDLQKDHLKAYAILHIRYRNHKSFIKFSLLLSGDVELNPGPIKNPCTICQGNVSIRDFFAKIVVLVATKNVALSPATQIIYVCNVKMRTYLLLIQATG